MSPSPAPPTSGWPPGSRTADASPRGSSGVFRAPAPMCVQRRPHHRLWHLGLWALNPGGPAPLPPSARLSFSLSLLSPAMQAPGPLVGTEAAPGNTSTWWCHVGDFFLPSVPWFGLCYFPPPGTLVVLRDQDREEKTGSGLRKAHGCVFWAELGSGAASCPPSCTPVPSRSARYRARRVSGILQEHGPPQRLCPI